MQNQNMEDFISLQRKYLNQLTRSNNFFLYFINNKEFKIKQTMLNRFNNVPIPFISHFNQNSYLSANVDVKVEIEAGSFDNALEHFIFYGFDEVKSANRRIGNEYPYMSEDEYIEINRDIKDAIKSNSISSGFEHFLGFGYEEFQRGERKLAGNYPFELNDNIIEKIKNEFVESLYVEANSDVEEAVKQKIYKNATEHFLLHGLEEVRKGTRVLYPNLPLISELDYVMSNDDIFHELKNGSLNSPFEHFLFFGAKEMVDGVREIKGRVNYLYKKLKISEEIKDEIKNFKQQPLISIVIPVYNVDPKWLELAIKSIENQWYSNWEICIADDKSTDKKTIKFLKSIDNSKIKIKFLDENVNISGASNSALELANGEYIGLIDNDDELTNDALYEIVKVINENKSEFIYSDEDKLELDGRFSEPHFKADYAPDMLLSQNYISHFTAIKKTLIDKVGGWEIGLEGSQDYDLYLKVLEHTNMITHIPKVLYHWRKVPGSTAAEFSDKSYAQDAGKKALENAMKRRDISSKVENGKYPGTYRVKYNIIGEPLVSIIIPFKDKPELLDISINSVLEKSTYQNYEIIGISNNSQESETFEMMKNLKEKDDRVSFYEYNVPFNYSDINNYAVNSYAKGEHIILLNNDIEIISAEWIESMLEFSQKEDIGAVGAKLYYPNDTIQHAGVIVGIGGVGGHSHKYFDKEKSGYFNRLEIIQNLSAVTAACLMVKKSIYDEMNGLNKKDLQIAFNDVDFCLRIQEKGYKNIYTPYCEAYHHESISRGTEDNSEKIKRFNKEVEYMKRRHKDILEEGDPYYNINLTLDYENFGLKG